MQTLSYYVVLFLKSTILEYLIINDFIFWNICNKFDLFDSGQYSNHCPIHVDAGYINGISSSNALSSSNTFSILTTISWYKLYATLLKQLIDAWLLHNVGWNLNGSNDKAYSAWLAILGLNFNANNNEFITLLISIIKYFGQYSAILLIAHAQLYCN